MRPKLPEAILPVGLLNCAWLKTLNPSMPTCRFLPSLILVSFTRAKSVLLSPGPWSELRPVLPNRPQTFPLSRAPVAPAAYVQPGTWANEAGSNQKLFRPLNVEDLGSRVVTFDAIWLGLSGHP